MAEADEADDGMILAEYARGYTFKGRLLRAARVKVGRADSAQKVSE